MACCRHEPGVYVKFRVQGLGSKLLKKVLYRGFYWVYILGVIQGDTSSLDYSLHVGSLHPYLVWPL